MKKFLKIAAIALGTILLILLLTPLIFEKQLKDMVQKTINENVNARVNFTDLNLSLLRNFPNATLSIDELSILNNAPFEGDTLAFSKEVVLRMSIKELFRDSGKPLKIDALELHQTLLNIKVDSMRNNNYDIAIEDTTTMKTSGGDGFRFDMQHYEINNSRVNYRDEGAKILLAVEDLNHKGNGDLSAEISTLSTFSSGLVSLMIDDVKYLNRNKVQLEADFKMDLSQQRYTFLENEALINQLPLTFDGHVQVNEDHNEVDISFKTPTSSFKNFLAVIPEQYAKNINEVQTQGDFVVEGFLKGKVDETHIPQMRIKMASNNASFKYPDLPKAVQDITIAAEVVNETGLADDTYMNINNLKFRIDQDAFTANGKLRNLTGNMLVNLAVDGTINLANLEQAYPLELEQELNGIVTANMTTSFDMVSIEKEQYQNVQSNGTASIHDFSYSSPEILNELKLATANMKFVGGNVTLQNFVATTGQTDLIVNGTIQNLMGYLFTDQMLKGNFIARSKKFSVNDFMVKEAPTGNTAGDRTETTATAEEAIKIPAFLDVQLNFEAAQVLYDNLVLNNAKGILEIANETATLKNVTADIFNGKIALNGNVSTAEPVPSFGMKLDLNSIDITRAFNDMNLLQNLAPIARALQGSLTTSIDLRGDLYEDLTPQLQSLAGNALAEVLGARVNPEETPLLARLDQNLNFVNLNDLNLKDLKTRLTFNDGQVEVQPFDFNIKGIKATASGSHGFDMNMNYRVALEIPAKILKDQLGSAFSKLGAAVQDTMTVSLPVNLTGTFNSPNIKLNMQQAVNNLSQKIISSQKDKLQERGRDILGEIISGKTKKDTAAPGQPARTDAIKKQEEAVKKAARDILGGLLGGKKKKKDSTQQ